MSSPGSRAREATTVLEPPVISRVGLLRDALPEAVVTTDTAHRITGWNGAAERLFGHTGSFMTGASVLDVLAHTLRSGTAEEVKVVLDRGEIWTGGAVTREVTGATLELRFTAAAIGAPHAPEGYVIVAHDITAQVRAERSAEMAEARFADFMAAAPAVAYIKDHEGRYVFVNEHALRLTSDPMQPDWLGKTDYDLWPPAVAAHIRQNDGLALTGALPLESIEILPLADGPHTMLMRKFPLRAATGQPLLGVVGLDITDRARAQAMEQLGQEREARAALLARERALVAGALGRLRTSGTVESIATSISQLILDLPPLGVAVILLFELDGRATPVGMALATGRIPERRPLPLSHSRSLQRRAKRGPWVEAWRPYAGDPLDEVIRALKVGVLGYAPIRSGEDLLGILAVGFEAPSEESSVTERLPAIVEFAGLAGALLGSSMAAQRDLRGSRSGILAAIEGRRFDPVFQPIVELASRTTVGYEALTRFHDGIPPAVRFAEAASVGLGIELEVATLDAAVQAASELPPDAWLNINVSPALIMAGDTLRDLLRTVGRPIVCEVTEHEAIGDYAIFRAALADLDGVRMAVDDAGAGFASFRHILELRPSLVKLDRSLVAGIDQDPLRQALIVGMRHFARSATCQLVAEGIETQQEVAALLELQVPLGQGYLLGRPAPAGAG
ncbi:hypothetical protein BH20CHL6_BH20CHL6_18300 [soil metagenome]